jgi:hypothetical protein
LIDSNRIHLMTEITGQIDDQALAGQTFPLAVEACPNGMVMIDHDGLARPRTLHVDDDADVHSLVKHELPMAEVIPVPSMEDARRAIATERFESLGAVVRDRPARRPAQAVKEFA